MKNLNSLLDMVLAGPHPFGLITDAKGNTFFLSWERQEVSLAYGWRADRWWVMPTSHPRLKAEAAARPDLDLPAEGFDVRVVHKIP